MGSVVLTSKEGVAFNATFFLEGMENIPILGGGVLGQPIGTSVVHYDECLKK